MRLSIGAFHAAMTVRDFVNLPAMKASYFFEEEGLEAPSGAAVAVDERLREIVLFNDDVNTFEHVILSLIEICDHNPIQAEQCAFIVHHNGKCSVKMGTYDELEAPCSALLERGLSAEIH